MIAFTEETLDNGLRVVLSPDKVAPAVALNITYAVGARNEHPGQSEMAHLFEHLMFEGSANIPKGGHIKVINDIGGTMNAMTAFDYTTYFDVVPSNHLETILWLEAERLANLVPGINQEGLDNQRDVVWNEHRQRRENVPYGGAIWNLMERVFPKGHPYHTTMTDILDMKDLQVPDVAAFFTDHYGPDNACLALVGDFDPDQAMAWVKQYLGAIPAKGTYPDPPDSTLANSLESSREVLTEKVPLPKLFVGWRGPVENSAEFEAFSVALAILGTGRGSRLHRRLVSSGIAVNAGLGAFGMQGGASFVFGSVTPAPGVEMDKAEAAFFDVLDSIVTEAPTAAEVDRARAMLERQQIQSMAGLVVRSMILAVGGARFGDPSHGVDLVDRLLAVEPAEAQRVAGEILSKEHRATLVYEPVAATDSDGEGAAA